MQLRIGLLFLAAILIGSCSNDKEDGEMQTEQNPIVGEWQATELQINEQTASDEAKLGKLALDFLTARDCFILTFNFKADLTVTAEDSADYLPPVEEVIIGTDFNCPTESDITTSTYTYDGSVLTTIDENGQTLSINVTVDGDIMTVDATDLNIESFNAEGLLIFTRK